MLRPALPPFPAVVSLTMTMKNSSVRANETRYRDVKRFFRNMDRRRISGACVTRSVFLGSNLARLACVRLEDN